MVPNTPTDRGRDVKWGEDGVSDVRSEWDEAFADAEANIPEDVPLHLGQSIRELDTDTVVALAEWVEVLARRRVVEREQAAEVKAADGETSPQEGSIVEKYQRCGKDGCACASGNEEDMHGPYRYHVTTKDGKRHWEYLGRA